MLEKITKIDQIEINPETKSINIRIATIILDEGQEISRSFHRHSIAKGDDYSNESELVQKICALLHTEETITN